MLNKKLLIPIILFFLVIFFSALFIVKQTEQALVLQFGDPIKVIKKPGLKIKIPLIQNAIFYDTRVLDFDAEVEEVILSDQKRLLVDAFIRYKIVDPLKFYQSVINESGFKARVGGILSGSLRRVLGSDPLEVVLSQDRGELMERIQTDIDKEAFNFGVKMVDVRIKRADLPKANSEAIFARMRAEREKEARQFRAEGSEESQRIKSKAEKEKAVIIAEANKEAQTIRGEGDGESVRIYAETFKKDEEFFSFYRSMEAYKKAFKDGDDSLILSPDSDFFKYFDSKTGN
ncbi:MAG: Modulator of FtsH protease HflC [Alphaproteobacteria bacterium MarineAlpha6_Bin3]|nr:MAG: Modulator of FtsH protease HflC [Alphaproteobacteria bacterium MarineAlpha6_Bin3]|tara:strand:- start:6235 stop:7098 length:864 start_codon:yes stop_codon:yes gene_type:complete